MNRFFLLIITGTICLSLGSSVSAKFETYHQNEHVRVADFDHGEGDYLARFMQDVLGEWHDNEHEFLVRGDKNDPTITVQGYGKEIEVRKGDQVKMKKMGDGLKDSSLPPVPRLVAFGDKVFLSAMGPDNAPGQMGRELHADGAQGHGGAYVALEPVSPGVFKIDQSRLYGIGHPGAGHLKADNVSWQPLKYDLTHTNKQKLIAPGAVALAAMGATGLTAYLMRKASWRKRLVPLLLGGATSIAALVWLAFQAHIGRYHDVFAK